MARQDAGQAREAGPPRRFDPGPPVDHPVILVNQDRHAEAEPSDGGCDLAHMGRISRPGIAGRRL